MDEFDENGNLIDEELKRQRAEDELSAAAPAPQLPQLNDILGYEAPEAPIESTPIPTPEQSQPIESDKLAQYQSLLSAVNPDRAPAADPVEIPAPIAAPAIEPEKPSKTQQEMKDTSAKIESVRDQLENDPNRNDSDKTSLQRYLNLLESRLSEMKDVQVTKKTKEEKASDKEVKDVEKMQEIEAAAPVIEPEKPEKPAESSDRIDNLIQREGNELESYKDSLGNETIGVGHLITSEEKESGSVYGIDISNGITEEQSKEILKKDLEKHNKEADRVMEDLGIDKSKLSEDQISALRDMNFQLGSGTQRDFKTTLGHIRDGNYEAAAKSVASSRWAKQTPVRVRDFQERIVNLKQEEPQIEEESKKQDPNYMRNILDGVFKQEPEVEPENKEVSKLQELLAASKGQTNIPNSTPVEDNLMPNSPANMGELRQVEDAGMAIENAPESAANMGSLREFQNDQQSQDITENPADMPQQSPEEELAAARKKRNFNETLANMSKYIKQGSAAYGGGRLTQLKADTSMEDDMAKKAGRPVAELLADRKAKSEKEIADMKKTILGDKVELSEKDSKLASMQRLKMSTKYSKELKGMDLEGLSFNHLKELEDLMKVKEPSEYQRLRMEMFMRRADQADTRIKDKNEDDLRTDVTKLAKEITKSELLPIEQNLDKMDEIISKHGDDVLNVLQRMTPGQILNATGEKGSAIIEAKIRLQTIINGILKKDSGAAVSDQEYERFKKKMGLEFTNAPGSVLIALKTIRESNAVAINNIRSGYSKDTNKIQQDRYAERADKKDAVKKAGKFKNKLKSGFTRMLLPNGKIKQIPTSKVEEAEKDGLKVVE